LTPEQFAQKFGANLQDITLVEAFAQAHNLTVTSADPVTRQVKITGTVANLEAAFAVQLHNYRIGEAECRLRQGPVSVPAQLQNVIIGVFGLDNRPQAKTHFRLAPDQAATDLSSFNPTQIAGLYEFPTGVTGAGETIGIIELGGGYQDSDITAYFQSLGIPAPSVVAVSVDGGQNTPTGDPNSADGEVLLDIEVAGAIASGANQKVFFAPNTDQGFIDAVTAAVHDTAVTLVSISWGQAEDNFTDQSRTGFNQAFQEASTLGKTIFVASGDNGSTDGLTDGQSHVDFPASAPFAVACGGTTLHASASAIDSEVVWNELAQNEGATGGGISRFFPLPDYQSNSNVPPNVDTSSPGRGVPDVAADADPATGYNVLIDALKPSSGARAPSPRFTPDCSPS
jgi:kumamolisin